jgi:hypothetical protein
VLGEIMGSVKRVSDIVAEIAAASEEQATGIDQVNNAITQMDDTTQRNAALVEEAASAAKSMEHQARELVSEMSFFQVRTTTAVARAPASVVTMPRPAPARVDASTARPVRKRAAGGGSADAVWQEF